MNFRNQEQTFDRAVRQAGHAILQEFDSGNARS